MGRYIIAYDLGTGGNKAALYDFMGNCLAENFVAYPTHYPKAGWHEQRPLDWWQAVIQSTHSLLHESGIDPGEIECLGISGHSLGVVPMDKNGTLLRDMTPIWSDSRSTFQASTFFEKVNEVEWYQVTGNGFPAALYSVFKIMWYRDNEPAMFEKISKVIGTKDYINYRLTGNIVTDYSYASGSGVYDLTSWAYSERFINASGLSKDIFPEIIPSTGLVGVLTHHAAEDLGLPAGVKIYAGGVDNSCMALGARNIKEGRIYNSQGSSSWIAVTSSKPILDNRIRPFVFTHVMPGLFNSAVPVFSSGTSFRWVRDQICKDLIIQAHEQGLDVYDLMTDQASKADVGSQGLIFNPNLAGGSLVDDSTNIRGAYFGLDLGHTQADLIRSAMEGIAMETRLALDGLRRMMAVGDEIFVVGGGSRSKLWRQIYADVYNMRIIKTNIDQQCAALGAAGLAAVGAGIWANFEVIDSIHKVEDITEPDPQNKAIYEKIYPIFIRGMHYLSEIGDMTADLNLARSNMHHGTLPTS